MNWVRSNPASHQDFAVRQCTCEIKDTLFHNREAMEDDFDMYQTKAIDYTLMSDDRKTITKNEK